MIRRLMPDLADLPIEGRSPRLRTTRRAPPEDRHFFGQHHYADPALVSHMDEAVSELDDLVDWPAISTMPCLPMERLRFVLASMGMLRRAAGVVGRR
jgi:hypothetical protein